MAYGVARRLPPPAVVLEVHQVQRVVHGAAHSQVVEPAQPVQRVVHVHLVRVKGRGRGRGRVGVGVRVRVGLGLGLIARHRVAVLLPARQVV